MAIAALALRTVGTLTGRIEKRATMLPSAALEINFNRESRSSVARLSDQGKPQPHTCQERGIVNLSRAWTRKKCPGVSEPGQGLSRQRHQYGTTRASTDVDWSHFQLTSARYSQKNLQFANEQSYREEILRLCRV